MSKRTSIVLGALLLLGAGVATFRVASRGARRGPLSPITDTMLRAAASAADGWLLYGRDYTNQRYVPLTQIDRHTVARLVPLWHHDPRLLRKSVDRNESTPLVADGMLIYTDAKNLVLALDARSGRELWRYQPELGPTALCCGVVNRGVALYGDRVYFGTLDARLIALDRRDGRVIWNHAIAEPAKGYSFTMAPLAVDGKIIIGASGGDFGIRGFVDAYDPETGRRVWRFWTVPSPEQGGWWGRWRTTTSEGDALPRDIAQERRDSAHFAGAWERGGGPVWSTPAYDPERRLLIFGTGNPANAQGVIPPGDNLYTVSLVALDIATGTLRWYYQMVPHDLWDYDAASPVVLFDVRRHDSVIPAAGHAGKNGWVYVVDRRTGAPLYRSAPVIPQENIFAPPTLQGIRVSPGTRGGSNWPPAAYSPATGLLYVLGSYIPMTFRIDSAAVAKGKKTGEPLPYANFRQLDGVRHFGTFTAIDGNTGAIRWQDTVPEHLLYGGALATGGGLVFFGETGGYLDAVDAETGKILWRHRVAASVLGPPISFEIDGQQRIAITSRSGITVFGLPGGS